VRFFPFNPFQKSADSLTSVKHRGMDNVMLWTPDDQHLIYQHRSIEQTGAATVTLSARQIHVADPQNCTDRMALDDPNYDYHLCDTILGCQWSGDWIPARKTPFRPGEYADYMDMVDYASPIIQCVENGNACESVEQLALNWRTGETVPLDQIAFSTPTPVPPHTPTPTSIPASRPDTSHAPLYADPAGEYALFPGDDGHSLWCVPAAGKPSLWVRQGQHFFYVP
jgi:hypothetical protein